MELSKGPAGDKSNGTRTGGWSMLRAFLGLFLFLAAGAKSLHLVTILEADGLLSWRPLLLIAITFEAALATYLIIGDAVWAWRLTVPTFVVFALSALIAIATDRNCNCILQSVGPQYMFPLDLLVLMLAVWFRPHAERSVSQSVPAPESTLLSLRIDASPCTVDKAISSDSKASVLPLVKNQPACLGLCATVGVLFAAMALVGEQKIDRTDPLKFLIADMMVDKKWPLDSRFHADLKPLESGQWLVFIARQDCDHCRQLMETQFADAQRHRDAERTVTFIAGSDQWPFQLDTVSMHVDPASVISWKAGEPFVASPAVFVLKDGLVTDGRNGDDSDAFVEQLFGEESASDR